MLVAIGLILTLSPVVYRALEGAQFLKVAAVGLLVVGRGIRRHSRPGLDCEAPALAARCPHSRGRARLGAAARRARLCRRRRRAESLPVQLDPRQGPRHGRARAADREPADRRADRRAGHRLDASRPTPRNMARWRGWWRIANVEQLSTFVAITFVTIAFTSLLAFSTLSRPRRSAARHLLPAHRGRRTVGERPARWFGRLFWFVGAFSLFARRARHRRLYQPPRRRRAAHLLCRRRAARAWSTPGWSGRWSLSGIVIIASGLTQPLVLLVTSACIAAFMMFVYSALLIVLNRRLLRARAAPGRLPHRGPGLGGRPVRHPLRDHDRRSGSASCSG